MAESNFIISVALLSYYDYWKLFFFPLCEYAYIFTEFFLLWIKHAESQLPHLRITLHRATRPTELTRLLWCSALNQSMNNWYESNQQQQQQHLEMFEKVFFFFIFIIIITRPSTASSSGSKVTDGKSRYQIKIKSEQKLQMKSDSPSPPAPRLGN